MATLSFTFSKTNTGKHFFGKIAISLKEDDELISVNKNKIRPVIKSPEPIRILRRNQNKPVNITIIIHNGARRNHF